MAFVCIVICPGQDPQRFVVYWRDSTLILWLHVRKKLSTMWLEAGVTYLVRPYRFLCGNLTSKNLMSTSCIRQRETIHQEDVIGVAVPLGVFFSLSKRVFRTLESNVWRSTENGNLSRITFYGFYRFLSLVFGFSWSPEHLHDRDLA